MKSSSASDADWSVDVLEQAWLSGGVARRRWRPVRPVGAAGGGGGYKNGLGAAAVVVGTAAVVGTVTVVGAAYDSSIVGCGNSIKRSI